MSAFGFLWAYLVLENLGSFSFPIGVRAEVGLELVIPYVLFRYLQCPFLVL